MAVTRADTYTSSKQKKIFFSDFLDSFAASPYGGALAITQNENSVKQSVKNLVLTNVGERLFQPNIGTNVNRSLFEPNDAITQVNLQLFIENTIKNYEPRVNNLSVSVVPSDEQNYLKINIIFSVINNPNTPVNLTINLKRVR